MANKNPSQSTRIKKGQVLNPSGRPKIAPDLKDFRKATSQEYKEAIKLILHATESAANAIISDENETLLNKTHAKALLECAQNGNVMKLAYFTDRAFGKPKESVDVNLTRPSILIKRDGTQMQFINEPINGEEE